MLLVEQRQTFVECSILVTEERFWKFFRVHKTWRLNGVHKTVILPVFYGGGNKHMLRVLENRLLGKIFGTKRVEETEDWRKLQKK